MCIRDSFYAYTSLFFCVHNSKLVTMFKKSSKSKPKFNEDSRYSITDYSIDISRYDDIMDLNDSDTVPQCWLLFCTKQIRAYKFCCRNQLVMYYKNATMSCMCVNLYFMQIFCLSSCFITLILIWVSHFIIMFANMIGDKDRVLGLLHAYQYACNIVEWPVSLYQCTSWNTILRVQGESLVWGYNRCMSAEIHGYKGDGVTSCTGQFTGLTKYVTMQLSYS